MYLLLSCGIRAVGSENPWIPVKPSLQVPADGTLEAVTWNLHWFGDAMFGKGGSNGPPDEQLQARNIVTVLDSMNADLYALQEVYSQEALETISSPLTGYRGFVAGHIRWIQKTAFIYNTEAIDSVSAGAITTGMNKADWAAGRYPLYFKFNYNWNGRSIPVMAVVIHAKAFNDRDSYFKRKRAAEQLYRYLQTHETDTRIIILGDFNDDVDQSIYAKAPSPYLPFVSDSSHFKVVTQTLSESGKTSTHHFREMIDHITISDELFAYFIPGSESVYDRPLHYIKHYSSTTSDHFPVWAKFSMKKGGF